jgi:hypothetical protein
MKSYNTTTKLYPNNYDSVRWTKDDPFPQVEGVEHGYVTMADTTNRKCSTYATKSYTWTSEHDEFVQRYELINGDSDCCVGFVILVDGKFYLRGYNPDEINCGRLHFWHLHDVATINSSI